MQTSKIVGMRFLKGFISSAVAMVSVVSLNDIKTWTELGSALNNLLIIAVVGGISGGILAVDKWLRLDTPLIY